MQNSSQEFTNKRHNYFGTMGAVSFAEVLLLSKCYATILILAVINKLTKASLFRKITGKEVYTT